MNFKRYLERISYSGNTDPTLATLRALHVAHLIAVPFENLNIHLHQPILLEINWLFDKIVTRGHGGFCYELNGLFAWLLRELGFKVTMLNARVHNGDGVYGIEFDHMVLRVELDEAWLADEWKYLIRGSALEKGDIETVVKLSPTDKVIIITVYAL